jgi:ethanolamine ammonia-lyase small subunit
MTKAVKSLTDMERLKALTTARIGLTRAGSSLATREVLAFDLDHARARDAVHLPFNAQDIEDALHLRNLSTFRVSSAAADRATYLQRPDLGRLLDGADSKRLSDYQANAVAGYDLAIIVADGLSTRAIHENAVAFLDAFLPLAEKHGWRQAPIVIASQARVAIADEIGDLLAARLSIILIGERPGLTAADSMGIYVTFAPRKGRTDAERNCLSNIRPAGLALSEASRQLERLILSAFDQGVTGVAMKQ